MTAFFELLSPKQTVGVDYRAADVFCGAAKRLRVWYSGPHGFCGAAVPLARVHWATEAEVHLQVA